MLAKTKQTSFINQRVRAILLTEDGKVLLIKRVKPNNSAPYWVAPGGGVEGGDADLVAALERELYEELGANATVLDTAFVLEHHKAGKHLEEHFFICLLQNYDLSKRYGPEFDDPRARRIHPRSDSARPLRAKPHQSQNAGNARMDDFPAGSPAQPRPGTGTSLIARFQSRRRAARPSHSPLAASHSRRSHRREI